MDGSDKNCILFFVKYPEKGQVKTRLSAELDETTALELYRSFTLDLLWMLQRLGIPFQICFSPENSGEKFMKWLGDGYSYMPQRGDDLGQKMRNALVQTFDRGFDRAVIIGSDSPDLPGEIIREAFSSLRTHDAVIGPSYDGGYYLIGFNSNTMPPGAFDGIQWSTDTVFGVTASKLEDAGVETCELPEWRDIDILADLKSMFMRNHRKDFSASRTMSYIAKNQWLLQKLSDP